MGVNSNGDIYQKIEDSWVRISGNLTYISVGSFENIVGVNSNGKLFRRDPWNTKWENGYWVKENKKFTDVDVSAKDKVVGIGIDGKINYFDGNKWIVIDGSLKDVAINFEGALVGIDKQNKVKSRVNGIIGGKWVEETGSLADISAGRKNNFWGLTSDGKIWNLTDLFKKGIFDFKVRLHSNIDNLCLVDHINDINIETCEFEEEYMWPIHQKEGGRVQIAGVLSGNCISLSEEIDDERIYLKKCSEVDAQFFTMETDLKGSPFFKSKKEKGCLEISELETGDLELIHQESCSEIAQQLWSFDKSPMELLKAYFTGNYKNIPVSNPEYSLWDPMVPEGHVFFGHTVNTGKKKPNFKVVIARDDDSHFSKPLGFEKIAESASGTG
jgi:hypothetical protein